MHTPVEPTKSLTCRTGSSSSVIIPLAVQIAWTLFEGLLNARCQTFCDGAFAGSDVGGKMENLPDTFAMLRQSRTVPGMDLVVVLCVLAANIGGTTSANRKPLNLIPILLSCVGLQDYPAPDPLTPSTGIKQAAAAASLAPRLWKTPTAPQAVAISGCVCRHLAGTAMFGFACISNSASLRLRGLATRCASPTAGVYVTVYLGSVFRAVLTVTLSGLIWALDVALWYSPLGQGIYGEPLDPQVGVGHPMSAPTTSSATCCIPLRCSKQHLYFLFISARLCYLLCMADRLVLVGGCT